MKDKIFLFMRCTIAYCAMALISILFLISIFSTSYFDPGNMWAEHPLYRWDNPLWFFLFAMAVFLFLYFADQKEWLEKLPSRILLAGLLAYTFAISLHWVNVSGIVPDADQKAVSFVASLTAQNNFLFFEPEKYMQIYPNQLGMVSILEILYRLSGGEHFRLFQYLNCVGNCLIFGMLYLFVEKCLHKKRITNLFLILCFGCCHLILYSTFLYGTTLGLAFALVAVYLELLFLERKKWYLGISSAVFISLSILIKNNYSIFFVGMLLLLLYTGIHKKRPECIFLAFLSVLLFGVAKNALEFSYETRSGMELGDGMPKIMWIAMGMQEGDRGEGWYNAFNYDIFRETGCNAEKSTEIAKTDIGESVDTFKNNPAYALRFYYRKFVSQWNEPTYESLWVNISHQGKFPKIIQSLYDGKLNKIMVEYMNLYQSLLLSGASIAFIRKRRQWSEEQLLFPLILLGGFLFHMIWEAKSQYIISYFILLLPYAAAGMESILCLNIPGKRENV